MKKTYMIPTLDVVEIKFTQQLLAGSVTGIDIIDDATDGDIGLSRSDDLNLFSEGDNLEEFM